MHERVGHRISRKRGSVPKEGDKSKSYIKDYLNVLSDLNSPKDNENTLDITEGTA